MRRSRKIPEREKIDKRRTIREEELYTVRNYMQTRKISVYLCIIHDIVKIEIYSCNKELYAFKIAWFSLLYCLSVQRLENLKTSIVYHGAPIYTYACNMLPLDNSKTHSHLALPYRAIYNCRINCTCI